MMRFRVKEGHHAEKSRRFGKGDVVEVPHDLERMFPGKFERLPDAPPTQVEIDREAFLREEKGTVPGSSPRPEQDLTAPLGTDVTEEFPAAKEAGLLVFRKAAFFYLADPLRPTEALNDKALRRDAVAGFVQELFHGKEPAKE